MQKFTCLVALSAALATTRWALAIGASESPIGPSAVSTYPGDRNSGFLIIAGVSYDNTAGPWHKELVNAENQGIPSGRKVPIDEHLTNIGPQPWTDWHEEVLSTTDTG